MNHNETESELACPNEPGLSSLSGFNPGFDLTSLLSDPTANWHVVGWLVCLAFLVSIWGITLTTLFRNLKSYYNPKIQRHKLRVILFPPVYATLSWFSYLRFDYATTIMFFATCFEAFAVFNLYACLQAYLKPFRREQEGAKEAKETKILFVKNFHLSSKWGMHYRIITDILVLQYPVWALIDAFASILTELKGVYCEGVFSFRGAYVYLIMIDFVSLSIILGALFTYLDIYREEWKRGLIPAHGMFWCVKGPIMVIFYFGEILLTFLTMLGVIQGTDGSHGSVPWPAEAVKHGIYVIIICFVMLLVSVMMARYFSPKDNIEAALRTGKMKKLNPLAAFTDAYVVYIPEFFYKTLCCGADSYRLMRKRRQLRKRRDHEYNDEEDDTNTLATQDTTHQLLPPSHYGMQEIVHPPPTPPTTVHLHSRHC